jgi:hypothetical protein
MTTRREVRIEQLLGRQVIGANGRPVGRIEEFRAQRHGQGAAVNEILLGLMGMLARLDVGRKLLFGGKRPGYIVRMDQIDISDPEKPKLTVAVEALEKI